MFLSSENSKSDISKTKSFKHLSEPKEKKKAGKYFEGYHHEIGMLVSKCLVTVFSQG